MKFDRILKFYLRNISKFQNPCETSFREKFHFRSQNFKFFSNKMLIQTKLQKLVFSDFKFQLQNPAKLEPKMWSLLQNIQIQINLVSGIKHKRLLNKKLKRLKLLA